MNYSSIIGIDVASEKLDLCVQINGATAYTGTIEYTDATLSQFLAEHPEINTESAIIGMESTGDYHRRAATVLLERGFTVKLLNPILTKRYTNTTIRGIKTDKTDAELIAKLVAEGLGDPLDLAQLQDQRKDLLRLSTRLVQVSSQLQLVLQSIKRRSLSEAEHLERGISDIIEELHDLADDTVEQVTAERSDEERFIDSIPGFSTKLSAVVHHEIGDVGRFPGSKSLVAFAGLDPKIRQSGKKLNTTGKLTKRGSAHLRAALFLASNVARNYDSELKAYYEKKKAEGKKHSEILCIISRKLLARIYTVLKERREYVKR